MTHAARIHPDMTEAMLNTALDATEELMLVAGAMLATTFADDEYHLAHEMLTPDGVLITINVDRPHEGCDMFDEEDDEDDLDESLFAQFVDAFFESRNVPESVRPLPIALGPGR